MFLQHSTGGYMEANTQEYKFFYDSVRNGIKVQNGDSIDETIYTFFDEIQITTNTRTFYIDGGIEHTVIDIKYSKKDFALKALFYDKIVKPELVSEEFRDSKTFKPDETNSYETSYFHFMISEKGFAVYKKQSYYDKIKPKTNETDNDTNLIEQKDTADQVFYRILMMYLLAIAYNRKMDKLSNDMANIYTAKENSWYIENFIEKIHAFDLQYFFENPVKMDRYQTYNFWKIISTNYNVKAKHDEIKSQVIALADILSRNREKEALLLSQRILHQEQQREKEANKRELKLQKRVTCLGILIAIIPIILELPIPYSRLMEINFINSGMSYIKNLASLGFEFIKTFLNSLL